MAILGKIVGEGPPHKTRVKTGLMLTNIHQAVFNPRSDGGLGQLRADGGADISKTKQRSEKRQTAFESMGEGLPENTSVIFR